jgi:hypothetical protein
VSRFSAISSLTGTIETSRGQIFLSFGTKKKASRFSARKDLYSRFLVTRRRRRDKKKPLLRKKKWIRNLQDLEMHE